VRVIDLGPQTDEHETWVDPTTAAILYPTELAYVALPAAWSATAVYAIGDDVAYNGKFYKAKVVPVVGTTIADADWTEFADPTANNLRTEHALVQATWILNLLTRGKLHGVECWTEDYKLHSCEVKLRRSPVAEVTHVSLVRECGREVLPQDFTDWCQINQSTVSFCCNCHSYADSCGGCGGTVARIEYRTASNMPPGAAGIVARLASEHAKASAGQKCALPDRISSVTRQGVSWTILDPQEFLDKGRIGIGDLDQWIETAKKQTGSGTMIDPLRSDRVFSQRADCSRGQFGDQDPSDPVPDPFTHAFKTDS
jgi:hypothetical protein